MKGTIISGEEVLKIIAGGDLENISKIYEIYKAGEIQIDMIGNICTNTVIQDCHNEGIIFIKIEK